MAIADDVPPEKEEKRADGDGMGCDGSTSTSVLAFTYTV